MSYFLDEKIKKAMMEKIENTARKINKIASITFILPALFVALYLI